MIKDDPEVLHIQQLTNGSAAGALSISIGPVPARKAWTFQAASYVPDVTETKVVFWSIVTAGGLNIAVSVPASVALTSTRGLPLITEGMELTLLPGQSLQVQRDSATAGSVMYILSVFVETDLPFYEYIEPQERRRIRRRGMGFLQGPTPRSGGQPVSIMPVPPPKGSYPKEK